VGGPAAQGMGVMEVQPGACAPDPLPVCRERVPASMAQGFIPARYESTAFAIRALFALVHIKAIVAARAANVLR